MVYVQVGASADAIARDLPGVLMVSIAGVTCEMKYKHYSSAFAAATRIVRALGLVKMPKVAAWRSKAFAP